MRFNKEKSYKLPHETITKSMERLCGNIFNNSVNNIQFERRRHNNTAVGMPHVIGI